MKRRFFLGFIVSLFFLYLVFHKVDLKEIIKILTLTNIVYILLTLSLMIPTLLVRSIRWKILLGKKVSIMNFFEAISVGIMSNNLFPFRVGDLVQIYFLGYKTKISKATIFSTVILERMFDFFAMWLILVCGSFFVLLPKEIPKGKIGLLLVVLFLFIYFILRSQKKVITIFERILPKSRFKEGLTKTLENFYLGLSFVNKGIVLIKAIFFTFLLWFFCSLGLYLCLLSLNIKLSILASTFILSMTGLAAMVPASPASVGPLEFFITTGLTIFGIEKNHAVSFAFVYRVMSWLPPTLLGLIVLIKNNLSIKQIRRLDKY